MTKLLLILTCLIIKFQPLNAKVEKPNYNFDLETLSVFFPGNLLSEIDSKFGKGEGMSDKGGLVTFKYKVNHTNFSFMVLVHAKDGTVEDFFVRLPSYFLHDVFFQSLINRYGKQTTFKKTLEEAYYVWDAPPLKHTYSASCTITCFPIFYSVEKKDTLEKSLLREMQSNKWP
jgi:hypothetical protein